METADLIPIAARVDDDDGPDDVIDVLALRALAHAWRSWCRVDVVVDPERMFNDAAYIAQVTLGTDDDDDDDPKWRLLVLEDCDELLRADAKRGTGQALSRLLNLTDGLIGQGLDVLVCLTTNEPLHALHPAITRPVSGRDPRRSVLGDRGGRVARATARLGCRAAHARRDVRAAR